MVVNHYYNVFRKADDKFLGTVAVRYDERNSTPPSIRACLIAEAKLVTDDSDTAVSCYAVMSTKEMHLQYGLN